MSRTSPVKVFSLVIVAALIGSLLTLWGVFATRKLKLQSPTHKTANTPSAAKARSDPERKAVAALGTLEPAGEIRVLAAPIAGISLPRLTGLFVEVGDQVKQGELLATFDTGPSLRAQRELLLTRIATLNRRLSLEFRELSRYRNLTQAGAFAADELDRREQQYLQLQGESNEAKADLKRIQADIENAELRSPIDGTVLKVVARVGERPGEKGVLEIGANQQMQAVLEVYESDISQVRLGQSVELTSENGGFDGKLEGQVALISPQVRKREVLSTDPNTDVDARIVEVRADLSPEDTWRVRDLSGLKVIGRFLP
jgi:HlyD family secretion protein